MTSAVLGDDIVEKSMLQLQIGQQSSGTKSVNTSTSEEVTEIITDDANVAINDIDVITDRLKRAVILEEKCKIFVAEALLDGIDPKHFEKVHHDIMKEAKLFRRILQDSSSPITAPSDDESQNHMNADQWIKQGEQHDDRHDFAIYYKVSATNQITCRIETPIKKELLIPILAVLNESELYKSWIPQYNVPRLKVVKSEKLKQSGRTRQTILVETEVPWPIAKRELILKAVSCDDIDSDDGDGSSNSDSDENTGKKSPSRILVRIQSLDCEDSGEDGLEILPAKDGVRIKVDGGFVFEKCPSDHPMAKKSLSKAETGDGNDMILLTFTFSVDPKFSILPQAFLNFFLRIAMRQIWGMFLRVAEEVGDGKRPEHSEVIERKREELYDWVEERTNAMLQQS